MSTRHPIGRFAPSPSGPLHAGSAATALASWLDARARSGRWLVRIEDIDAARTVPGAAQRILAQLDFLGLVPDAVPWVQSAREARYRAAFERLQAQGRVFGCACTRREIADSVAAIGASSPARTAESVYPGTCRHGIAGGRAARAWRFRVDDDTLTFEDRWMGPQHQYPARDVGDFVIRRADGFWAYQLAVVVDDADAGITDVVRGQDLLDSTGRQILLQRSLGLPTPTYLHVPLVVGADGSKLSKQNGAVAIDDSGAIDPCDVLDAAIRVVGIAPPATRDRERWLAEATDRWADALAYRRRR